MKRNNIGFIFIIVICALFISSFKFPWQKHHVNAPKTISGKSQLLRIAVIGLPDELTNRIIEHLTISKRFVPVERQALNNALFEQRFGKTSTKSYLDKTLDKAIKDMDKVEGRTVNAVGNLAIFDDFLKAVSNLGSAVGADYIILGNLEKLTHRQVRTSVPYSKDNKEFIEDTYDARLRIRVVEVKTSTVVGATSFRFKTKESIFNGKVTDKDSFSFLDELGRVAAAKILSIIFPARIVKLNPIVISRGKNDGTEKGDIYLIQREGESVYDDTGVMIGHLKKTIGRVKITDVQETLAIATPIDSTNFKVGDLAVFSSPAKSKTNNIANINTTPLRKNDTINNLPTIAVGLIRSGSTAGKYRQNLYQFTDTIISRLTQTKRFRVIDRQEVDQLLNEQLAQAIVSGEGLKSAMGTLKGADYLLYGSVTTFDISTKLIKIPHSTRTFKKTVGVVEGNIRVVDVRSGVVKESRKIIARKTLKDTDDTKTLMAHLSDAFAKEAVSILMNVIYPIKIVAIDKNQTIYINRGNDGGLIEGEILKAYRPGKNIVDPDTKVRLGNEEYFVGKIVVKEVEDTRSKATQISGNQLRVGDILKIESKQKPYISNIRRIGSTLPTPNTTTTKEHGRYTLAVGLLKITPRKRTDLLSNNDINIMTNELIAKLSNTNRFKIMERQEVDQILEEKEFVSKVQDGDIEDMLKQLKGADYLIYGEISIFNVDITQNNVPYVNETETLTKGIAEGVLRIVDVATGAIVVADKIHAEFKTKSKDATTSKVKEKLMDLFTSKIVSCIMNRMFPTRVIGLSEDGFIYVNRGKDGGLKIGDMFNLMRPGKEMTDIDTGLSFGQTESKIGLAEVVGVEPFRAKCKLISGQYPKIGDILRVSNKRENKTSVNKPKVMQPNW